MQLKLYELIKSSKIQKIVIIAAFSVCILNFVFALSFSTNWARFGSYDKNGQANDFGYLSAPKVNAFLNVAQALNTSLMTLATVAVIFCALLLLFKGIKVKRFNIFHLVFSLITVIMLGITIKITLIDIQALKTDYVVTFSKVVGYTPPAVFPNWDDPGYNEWNDLNTLWMKFQSSRSSYSLTTFYIALALGILNLVVLLVFILYMVTKTILDAKTLAYNDYMTALSAKPKNRLARLDLKKQYQANLQKQKALSNEYKKLYLAKKEAYQVLVAEVDELLEKTAADDYVKINEINEKYQLEYYKNERDYYFMKMNEPYKNAQDIIFFWR